VDQAARKIMLLLYMERGWMYTQLKERIASDQSWMGVCKELGVCSGTANRNKSYFLALCCFNKRQRLSLMLFQAEKSGPGSAQNYVVVYGAWLDVHAAEGAYSL